MNNKRQSSSPHFLDIVGKILLLLAKAFLAGLKKIRQRGLFDFFLRLWGLFFLIVVVWHFDLEKIIFPPMEYPPLEWFFSLHWKDAFLLSFLVFVVADIFISGILTEGEKQRYEKNLSLIMGRENTGFLKVLKVENPAPDRKRIIVRANALGTEDFFKKKNRLSSAFCEVVEEVNEVATPGVFILTVNKNKLGKKYAYEELRRQKTEMESFIVGQAGGGIITQKIASLPHLLIAGTTGGGKSNFLKGTLLRLLETSSRIQMYLIDLKGGIEMRVFRRLPNIKVSDTIPEALAILKLVRDEMRRRFEYLNQEGRNEIVPAKDKMDRIIVAIDEASILFSSKAKASDNFKNTLKAREVTDEIAKLGRAAAVHLILATQKVSSKTIDTNIQENVTGKMCFRMNTLQGSLLVLGDKAASILPDIPGRGIWQAGNKQVEVQTPWPSKEMLNESLEYLSGKFSGKEGDIKMLGENKKENDGDETRNLDAATKEKTK